MSHVVGGVRVAPNVAGMAASAEAMTLGLLRSIDGTINTLLSIAKVFDGLASLINEQVEGVCSCPVVESHYLDPDDIAIDAMSRACAETNDFLTMLVRKRKSIEKDKRLSDHHCEELNDAYETAMGVCAELIDAFKQFRSAIITHDLSAEPRGGDDVCETVDALLASLR